MKNDKCLICNKEVKGFMGIVMHIKSHNITYKEYYDKFFKKDNDGLCKYPGCNNKTEFTNSIGYKYFCKHHAKKKDLKWYNARYGEELGIEKYNERRNNLKSSFEKNGKQNLEGYIKRFGEEEGIKKYNKKIEKIKKSCKDMFSLEWYINKYGKIEGTKKYNERCDSFSGRFTEEWFIKRDGVEQGKINYKKHCENQSKATKGKNTLKWYINKFGEEEGTRKYKENCNKLSERLIGVKTKQWYINKFGHKEGINLYKIQSKNISKAQKGNNTLEWYVNKYGKEEGTQRYKKYCKNKSVSLQGVHTLEWYIQRDGEKQGKINYKKFCETCSNSSKGQHTLEWFNERFDDGLTEYKKFWDRIISKRNIFGKASKESMNVFFPLMDWLLEAEICTLDEIYVGIGDKKEYFLNDIRRSGNFFWYDFTIPKFNIMIEYNGERYHPNPKWLITDIKKWNDWSDCFSNKTANEIYEENLIKNNLAKEKGFKILELWSSDSLDYNIDKSKKFIKGTI